MGIISFTLFFFIIIINDCGGDGFLLNLTLKYKQKLFLSQPVSSLLRHLSQRKGERDRERERALNKLYFNNISTA